MGFLDSRVERWDITCGFSRGIFENWSTRVTHLSG